jgi:hypothetical protein
MYVCDDNALRTSCQRLPGRERCLRASSAVGVALELATFGGRDLLTEFSKTGPMS